MGCNATTGKHANEGLNLIAPMLLSILVRLFSLIAPMLLSILVRPTLRRVALYVEPHRACLFSLIIPVCLALSPHAPVQPRTAPFVNLGFLLFNLLPFPFPFAILSCFFGGGVLFLVFFRGGSSTLLPLKN